MTHPLLPSSTHTTVALTLSPDLQEEGDCNLAPEL